VISTLSKVVLPSLCNERKDSLYVFFFPSSMQSYRERKSCVSSSKPAFFLQHESTLSRDLNWAICSHVFPEKRQAENSNSSKVSRLEWETLPSLVCRTLLGPGLQRLEKNQQAQGCVAASSYQATLHAPTEMRVDKGIF